MFTDHQPVAAGRRLETHHASKLAELLDREILPRLERPGRFVATSASSGLDTEPAGAPRAVILWPSEPGVRSRPIALEPLSSALTALSEVPPSFACVPPVELADELRQRGLRPFAHDSWIPLASYPIWVFVVEDPAQLLGVCRLLSLAGIAIKASERNEEAPVVLLSGAAVEGLDVARLIADRVLLGDAAEVGRVLAGLLAAPELRAGLAALPGLPSLTSSADATPDLSTRVSAAVADRRAAPLGPVHRAAFEGDAIGWDRDVAGCPRRVLKPWVATEELASGLGLAGRSERLWAAVDELAGDDDLTAVLRFAVGTPGECEADRAAIVDWVAQALRRSRLEPGRLTVQLLPFVGDRPEGDGPALLEESVESIHDRLRKLRCRVETGEPIAAWRGALLRSLGLDAGMLLFEALRRGAYVAESPLACDADLWHKALQAVHLDARSPEPAGPEPLRAAGSSCPESSIRTTHVPTDQRRESAVSAESKGSASSAVRGGPGSGAESTRPKPRPDRWRRWADLAPRHFDYRVEYSKRGRWRHLSQRELGELFLDICQRAEVPLATTGVAQRRARISFGPSLQVGVEGLREYIDLSLTRKSPQLESVLRPRLPRDLELLSVQFRPAGSARMGLGEIARASYEALIPLKGEGGISMNVLHERRDEIERSARRARLRMAAESKAPPDAIHQLVRIEIAEHPADDSRALLSFTLDLDCAGRKLRATELIGRLLDGLIEEPHLLPIRRTRLLAATSDGNGWITPSEQIESHRRELRARAKRCA